MFVESCKVMLWSGVIMWWSGEDQHMQDDWIFSDVVFESAWGPPTSSFDQLWFSIRFGHGGCTTCFEGLSGNLGTEVMVEAFDKPRTKGDCCEYTDIFPFFFIIYSLYYFSIVSITFLISFWLLLFKLYYLEAMDIFLHFSHRKHFLSNKRNIGNLSRMH